MYFFQIIFNNLIFQIAKWKDIVFFSITLYFFFLCIIFKTQFYKSQFTRLSITQVFNGKITCPKATNRAVTHNIRNHPHCIFIMIWKLVFKRGWFRNMSSVKLHITAQFVALRPAILLLKTWVNKTYSRWKIKLIYYIKTINYYNSDYKMEMYAKNYGYKVRSNNYSMCHW